MKTFARMIVVASVLAVAAGTVLSYESRWSSVTCGGGRLSGGSFHSMTVVGGLGSGTMKSATATNSEGFFPIFARPVLAVDAESVDFGNAGAFAVTETVSVSNPGGTTLLLGAFSFAGDPSPFHLAKPLADELVPSGDTFLVPITFTPSGEGDVFDTIEVTTNDPAQGVWKMPLHGTSGILALSVAASPSVVPAGTQATISAVGNFNLDSGMVYYRLGGEGDAAWRSAAMSLDDSVTLSAAIPGSLVGIRGVEYYVEAFAGEKKTTTPAVPAETPVRIPVEVTDAVSPTVESRHHTMISAPLNTTGATVADVLGDDLGAFSVESWRLGGWSQAVDSVIEYPADTGRPFDAGEGFWLVTASDKTYDVSGLSVYPDDGETYYAIPLEGGAGSVWWSQMGQPFAYDVAWGDCRVSIGGGSTLTVEEAADSGLIENAAYEYVFDDTAGSYRIAATLEPWHGYFVNNLSGASLDLLVPAVESNGASKTALADRIPENGEDGWAISIRLSSPGEEGTIVIGALRGSSDRFDSRDHLNPPLPGGRPAMIAIEPGDGISFPDELSADFREVIDEIETWNVVLRFRTEDETELTAASTGEIPAGIEVYIADDTTGEIRRIDGEETVRIVPAPGERERRVKIVAGPVELLRANHYAPTAPPVVFRLRTPYPNPSKSTFSIRYSLPAGGTTNLAVYGVNGRLVRSLVRGNESAGGHIATWDGRDNRGRPTGPGVYFLRLEAGANVQTARMVRLR